MKKNGVQSKWLVKVFFVIVAASVLIPAVAALLAAVSSSLDNDVSLPPDGVYKIISVSEETLFVIVVLQGESEENRQFFDLSSECAHGADAGECWRNTRLVVDHGICYWDTPEYVCPVETEDRFFFQKEKDPAFEEMLERYRRSKDGSEDSSGPPAG